MHRIHRILTQVSCLLVVGSASRLMPLELQLGALLSLNQPEGPLVLPGAPEATTAASSAASEPLLICAPLAFWYTSDER